jgi:hypothetical protein
LFSAINTAFIIAMQPNSVNTTNTLLVQLIQVTMYGPSAIQPETISPFTGYSSNWWTQALAYTSLSFSLLAALGAVLGKQWLGYYKSKRYGSLSDRCKQRHRKFQKLQKWQLENVLQLFPVLLQISVLLFGLSLGAAMWTQQRSISILIMTTTAFGALCHVFIVAASLIFPDCPFQTPVSLAIRAVFGRFYTSAGPQDRGEVPTDSTASASTMSAMQWILETSTNPDTFMSVVGLLPTMPVPKQPIVDMTLCKQVRDMFKACFDRRGIPILEDRALAYGKALLYFSSNFPDAKTMLRQSTRDWNIWEQWRILHLPLAVEECRMSYNRMIDTRNVTSKSHFQADMRTALHMAVAAGIDEFADPNDERLVWDGQFQLQSLGDHNWLMDCAEHFYDVKDIDIAGDALLLLIGNLDDSSFSDQHRITPFLNGDKGQSHRLRQIALRAACQAFSYRDNWPCDDGFSQAVLKAICPTIQNEHPTDNLRVVNAIYLLKLENWPEGSDLAPCSLLDIQLLVLLVLPAPMVDNSAMYIPYCRALVHHMGADKPFPHRYSAFRIAYNARKDLVIAAAGDDVSLQDVVLSELSAALLAVISSTDHQFYDDLDDSPHDFTYIRLISALAMSSNWHSSLIRDGHVKKCITLINRNDHQFWFSNFYLTEIFEPILSF